MKIGKPPKPNRAARRKAKRQRSASTAVSPRFEFEALEQRILMSTALLPVHDSVNPPDPTDRYAANPTDAAQVARDSQISTNGQINWTLQAAGGTVVATAPLAGGDGAQVTGETASRPLAGGETASALVRETASGPNDPQPAGRASAVPAIVDQPADGQLSPGPSTPATGAAFEQTTSAGVSPASLAGPLTNGHFALTNAA